MAWVSLRRGSGARDLTKATTCGETWTLVFIQDGCISHVDPAGLVIGNRLHRLAITHDFQSLDNRFHPVSGYDVGDGASVPGERHRTLCLGSPDNGGTFPLQIRDGTNIFHNESMYTDPPEKSTRLLGARSSPESLAMCLRSHPKGELVLAGRFRRRDADGGGRDDRVPLKIANDWGSSRRPPGPCRACSIKCGRNWGR